MWKKGFFQEWRWRIVSLTFLESTLKMELGTLNLSSVWFGVGCNIGWVTSVKARHCWSLTTNSFFVFISIYVKLIECKTWLRKTCNKSFLSSLAEWELKFEFLYTYWILTIFPKRNNGPLNFNSNSNSTSELIWTSCILLT